MKEKYRVIIEETLSDEFTVEAESEKDAIDEAIRQYKNGNLVLEPGNIEQRQVSLVIDNAGFQWTEF